MGACRKQERATCGDRTNSGTRTAEHWAGQVDAAVNEGRFKIKAQLMCGTEPAMGPGKALVLEAIDRTGSISAAGRDIGMSYRRIWLLVDSMNRCWSEKLVETITGGGPERGARLSRRGKEVLGAFRMLEQELFDVARRHDREPLLRGLLDQPRPPVRSVGPSRSPEDGGDHVD